MNEETQKQSIPGSTGEAQLNQMESIRDKILLAQKDAQRRLQAAVTEARTVVASKLSASAQTVQLAEQHQKEVEKAFRKAQEVVAGTFEQLSNQMPQTNFCDTQKG